jgi:hypothetical protein
MHETSSQGTVQELIMEVQHQNHNESAYYVENQDTIEKIVLAKGNVRKEN